MCYILSFTFKKFISFSTDKRSLFLFIGFLFLVGLIIPNSTQAQCVGTTTSISIPRNIGCTYGTGNNATWDGPVGGVINDLGGGSSTFTVTWSTTGTFRLTRTFPGGCTGTPLYSSYYTVSTAPTVAVSTASQSIYSGQMMTTINITNPNGISGTSFSWSVYAPNISGVSDGSGSSITQTLSQTTGSNQTATYTVVASTGACSSNPVTTTVTVMPAQVLPTITQCVGIPTSMNIPRNIGCSYGLGGDATWDGPVGGVINDPGGGSSTITVTWTTTGTFRLKRAFPVGCTGTPLFSNYYSIAPTPSNPTAIGNTRCGTGTVALSGTVGANGTTLRWFDALTGGSLLTTGTNYTTTSIPSTTTYYIESYNETTGCYSSPRIAVIATVNSIPDASVSLASQNACAGFAMTPVSITNPNSVSGTTFIWSVLAPNITGASSGTGASIYQTLSTVATSSQVATYTIVPSANGCVGASIAATVNVNPKPNVSTSPNQTICSGTAASISISNPNNVVGTAFSWSATPDNVLGSSIGNGSLIAQTLTSTIGGIVTYTITPIASGCLGTSVNVVVTVNARPNASANSQSICSGQNSGVTITNPNGVTGTTFSWTVVPNNVSGSIVGNGSVIAQTLTSSIGGTTTYTITPTANGCTGTPVDAVVTVNPIPSAPLVANSSRFGAGSLSLSATGAPTGGTYNWYNPSDVLLTSGGIYVTPTVVTTTSNYAYTKALSSQGCPSLPTWISIIIAPLPVITSANNRTVGGSNVTLDAGSGFATYDWRDGANALVSSNSTFTSNIFGLYTVTVTLAGVQGSSTSQPYYILGQLDGVNENYIVSNMAMIPSITNDSQFSNLPIENRNQSIQYFDGLGRPIQSVVLQGSPKKLDLVSPIAYDGFGREIKKYLPFASGNSGLIQSANNILDANGNYIGVPQVFYNTSSSRISVDAIPFATAVFEPSPVSRVIEQGAPGAAWQPGTGSTIKRFYEFNKANEVYLFTYSATDGKVILNTDAAQMFYQANQLSANRTQDERQNNVIEYVDKLGHTILKRVQVVSGAPSTTDSNRDTNYASTYYIYDDFGNLVVVLPPEAVKKLVP